MTELKTRAETEIVKQALAQAGVAYTKVQHGGRGWLEITLITSDVEKREETIRIAQKVTGRSGNYNEARIIVNSPI